MRISGRKTSQEQDVSLLANVTAQDAREAARQMVLSGDSLPAAVAAVISVLPANVLDEIIQGGTR